MSSGSVSYGRQMGEKGTESEQMENMLIAEGLVNYTFMFLFIHIFLFFTTALGKDV